MITTRIPPIYFTRLSLVRVIKVRKEGLEPSRSISPLDFKSRASAYFATPEEKILLSGGRKQDIEYCVYAPNRGDSFNFTSSEVSDAVI